MIDFKEEFVYKTSRSGGPGGQNVNKVETAVEAKWRLYDSEIATEQQKVIIAGKLKDKLSKDGLLSMRSTTKRSQLENKAEAAYRLNQLINGALVVKKPRIATKMPAGVVAKRKEQKRRLSELKQQRRQSGWE